MGHASARHRAHGEKQRAGHGKSTRDFFFFTSFSAPVTKKTECLLCSRTTPLLPGKKYKERPFVRLFVSFLAVSHDLGFRPQRDLPPAHGGLPPHLGRLPELRRPDDAGGAAEGWCLAFVDVGGIDDGGIDDGADRCPVVPPRLRPLRRGPAAQRARTEATKRTARARARATKTTTASAASTRRFRAWPLLLPSLLDLLLAAPTPLLLLLLPPPPPPPPTRTSPDPKGSPPRPWATSCSRGGRCWGRRARRAAARRR